MAITNFKNIDPSELGKTVWRYLPFSKFISLLSYGALWFAKLNILEDRFEGALPAKADAEMREQHEKLKRHFHPDMHEQIDNMNARNVSDGRELLTVNFWFGAEIESERIWREYAKDSEGVAIKSTIRALSQHVFCDPQISHIGRVKRPILSLVERGGRVRSFHIPTADKATVDKIVKDNIDRESKLHTDESKLYGDAADHFAEHETVKHSAEEYVRTKFYWQDGQPKTEKVHTNSAEGFFSIFKRGMKGIYQHCSEKHLHRYLAEYDFRYNNRCALGIEDGERAALAVKNAPGKRLTYRLAN